MPVGAVASAPSSAAQQSTPPRRPRYSVRAGGEPNQSWLFCNGSRAQAGRARTRGSSLGRSSGPISTSSLSPQNTNQWPPSCFSQAQSGSKRAGARNGSSIMALSIICASSMLSPVVAQGSPPAAPAAESELANAIRALAMDAVEAAKSGHPGMPMGMAEIAVALWKRHLRHNPANPAWFNRDRFILSNGHGSMLLYSLLHLTGYALPIEELKRFRQLGSKTPGPPERGCAPGGETTTGPLGQGLANAVGMALAERLLAARFNKPDHQVVDHLTYVFLGDGCMMEGISHEA